MGEPVLCVLLFCGCSALWNDALLLFFVGERANEWVGLVGSLLAKAKTRPCTRS